MANANAPAIVTAGQVVEIVGVQCGDGGRSCGAHDICGTGIHQESLVVIKQCVHETANGVCTM